MKLQQEYALKEQDFVKKLADIEKENSSLKENEQVILKEGKACLKQIKDNEFVFLLDLHGKEITSEDFAQKLNDLSLNFIDKKDYIAKEESDLKNIIVTTLNLLISSGAFYLSYKHNKNHVSFVVDDILYKYYQNYQSTEYLEQELTENNEKLMSLNRGNNNVK